MRSIPRKQALLGMVVTALAGCAGGAGSLPMLGTRSGGGALAPSDVLKIKVGRSTRSIPAAALRRAASLATPAPVTNTTAIGPGYSSSADGNVISESGDGQDVYTYGQDGALVFALDAIQGGYAGMPIMRMTGTNGTEVTTQMPDITAIPFDQTTTIGDFTIRRDSGSQTTTVQATIGDFGPLTVTAQPGSTGFVVTGGGDGSPTTLDYGLFGISQSAAAAMRGRAALGDRRIQDFNPSATCLALIATLIALLLAAAWFGLWYIRLAMKLAAFASNGLAIVNATLAKTLLITALTAVAGSVLGGAILKECFTGPATPTPAPGGGGHAGGGGGGVGVPFPTATAVAV